MVTVDYKLYPLFCSKITIIHVVYGVYIIYLFIEGAAVSMNAYSDETKYQKYMPPSAMPMPMAPEKPMGGDDGLPYPLAPDAAATPTAPYPTQPPPSYVTSQDQAYPPPGNYSND